MFDIEFLKNKLNREAQRHHSSMFDVHHLNQPFTA
jgi:hypothetical protein